jgi:predicted ArsR family transcriptional regulator
MKQHLNHEEARRKLAEAVADWTGLKKHHAALLIDENNNRDSHAKFTTLGKALDLDAAFCVVVKPHIVALDLDDEQGLIVASAIEDCFRQYGIRAVVCSSGGEPGRAHLFAWGGVYVRELEALAVEIAKQAGAHIDVRSTKGKGGRLRPPMSKHRTGSRSKLVGITPEEALKALSPPRVSRAAYEKTVINKDSQSNDRSAAIMQRACAHVIARSTFALWKARELEHVDGNSKHNIAKRKDLEKQLITCWEKAAARFGRLETLIAKRLDLSAAKAAALVHPELNSGRSNRSITFAAILSIAEVTGRLNCVHISCAALAEKHGINKSTAWRHIGSLTRDGWLKMAEPSAGRDAAAYHINAKRLEDPKCNPQSLPPNPPRDRAEREGHRRSVGGLQNGTSFAGRLGEALAGRGAQRRLWSYLAELGTASTDELAQSFKRRPAAVRKLLRKLEALGLVIFERGRWRVDHRAHVHAGAAAVAGKAYRNRARALEHQLHREGRRAYCKMLAELNALPWGDSKEDPPQRRSLVPHPGRMAAKVLEPKEMGQTSTAKGAPVAAVHSPMRV